jgi:hypothetical protein
MAYDWCCSLICVHMCTPFFRFVGWPTRGPKRAQPAARASLFACFFVGSSRMEWPRIIVASLTKTRS